MHTKDKGNIALSNSIAWFCANGYSVFLPVGDNGGCVDLVVIPKLGLPRRVQCKYTSKAHKNGRSWVVDLRASVGRSYPQSTLYALDSFDVLFVSTPTGNYMVEWAEWCSHLGSVPTQLGLNKHTPKSDIIRKL